MKPITRRIVIPHKVASQTEKLKVDHKALLAKAKAQLAQYSIPKASSSGASTKTSPEVFVARPSVVYHIIPPVHATDNKRRDYFLMLNEKGVLFVKSNFMDATSISEKIVSRDDFVKMLNSKPSYIKLLRDVNAASYSGVFDTSTSVVVDVQVQVH